MKWVGKKLSYTPITYNFLKLKQYLITLLYIQNSLLRACMKIMIDYIFIYTKLINTYMYENCNYFSQRMYWQNC